jgi:acyl-CoA thioester hydrolase
VTNPSAFVEPAAELVPCSIAPQLGAFNIPHPQPFVCAIRADRRATSRAIAHVSNIEFVRWLDRAAELHADSLGYTRRRLLDDGVMWFVARHEIDYLAEAWPGDGLLIATWVRDMHKVKSWRDYAVVRPGDGSVICRAATLWVLVDLGMRRPIRIPDEMVQRFAPLNVIGRRPEPRHS